MSLKDAFIDRAEAYAARQGIGLTNLSRQLFGDGGPYTLTRMKNGASCSLDNFEAADAKLRDLEAAEPEGAGRKPTPAEGEAA